MLGTKIARRSTHSQFLRLDSPHISGSFHYFFTYLFSPRTKHSFPPRLLGPTNHETCRTMRKDFYHLRTIIVPISRRMDISSFANDQKWEQRREQNHEKETFIISRFVRVWNLYQSGKMGDEFYCKVLWVCVYVRNMCVCMYGLIIITG